MIDTKKLLFAAFLAAFLAPAVRAANLPIQWQAVTSTNLRGYRVYYGTSSRAYTKTLEAGKGTTYAVPSLTPATYYFAVTVYDSAGTESAFSDEVSKTIL